MPYLHFAARSLDFGKGAEKEYLQLFAQLRLIAELRKILKNKLLLGAGRDI